MREEEEGLEEAAQPFFVVVSDLCKVMAAFR